MWRGGCAYCLSREGKIAGFCLKIDRDNRRELETLRGVGLDCLSNTECIDQV